MNVLNAILLFFASIIQVTLILSSSHFEAIPIPKNLKPPTLGKKNWSDVEMEDSQMIQAKKESPESLPKTSFPKQPINQQDKEKKRSDNNRLFIEWAQRMGRAGEQSAISQKEADERRVLKEEEADNFELLMSEPLEKEQRNKIVREELHQRKQLKDQHLQEERLQLLESLQRGAIREQELEERLRLLEHKSAGAIEKQPSCTEEVMLYDDIYENQEESYSQDGFERKDRFSKDRALLQLLEEEESENRQILQQRADLALQNLLLEEKFHNIEEDRSDSEKKIQAMEQSERAELQMLEQNAVKDYLHKHRDHMQLEEKESRIREELSAYEQKSLTALAKQEQNERVTLNQQAKKRAGELSQAQLQLQQREADKRFEIAKQQSQMYKKLTNQQQDEKIEAAYYTDIRLKQEATLLDYLEKNNRSNDNVIQLLGKGLLRRDFLLNVQEGQEHSNLILLLNKAIDLSDQQVIILLLKDMKQYAIDLTVTLNTIIKNRTLFQKLILGGDLLAIKHVLDTKEVDINSVITAANHQGVNTLMVAVINQNLPILHELLRSRPGLNYATILKAKDLRGWTVFMRVAGIPKINPEFKYEAMKVLLQSCPNAHWGDILMTEAQGFDVLTLSIYYGLKDVISLLLQERPHFDVVAFVSKVRMGMEGLTPLQYAQSLYEDSTGAQKDAMRDIIRLLECTVQYSNALA